MERLSKSYTNIVNPEYLRRKARQAEIEAEQFADELTDIIIIMLLQQWEHANFENRRAFIASTKPEKAYEKTADYVRKEFPKVNDTVKQTFIDSAKDISKDVNAFTERVAESVDPRNNLNLKKELERVTFADRLGKKTPDEVRLTNHEMAQIESSYKRTCGDLKNLTRTTAEQTQRAFIDALDRAYERIQQGESQSTAILETIKELARQGVTCVSYPTGRVDRLEVAVARAVRTGINQANGRISLMRCAGTGVNFVYVSEHYDARVTPFNDYTNHSYWQGQVYSLNWTSTKRDYNGESLAKIYDECKGDFPRLKMAVEREGQTLSFKDFETETGYGDILGLCGINCRHTFSPFYPEYMDVPERIYNDTSNQYDKEQRQRSMERAIRATKRAIRALEHLNTPEAIKERLQLEDRLKQQLDAYNRYVTENKLSTNGARLKTTDDASVTTEREQDTLDFKPVEYNDKYNVDWDKINSNKYVESLKNYFNNDKMAESVKEHAITLLKNNDGSNNEEMFALDAITGEEIASIIGKQKYGGVIERTPEFIDAIKTAIENGREVLLMHNHPSGNPPSLGDVNILVKTPTVKGLTIGHTSSIFNYSAPCVEIDTRTYNIAWQSYRSLGFTDYTSQQRAHEQLLTEFNYTMGVINDGR